MSDLVLFESARHALAECKSVDEVKHWADRAAATQAYARMAKDKSLEVDAAEIRIRAERRLGEMLSEQKQTVGLSTGAKGIGKSAVVTNDRTRPLTLAEVGISKDLSARAQKIAAVPAAEFEAEVSEWRDRVSAEGERVTARLESSGASWQAALQHKPTNDAPTEADSPAREVVDDVMADIIADHEMAMRIIEADDKLAEAWGEAKTLAAKYEQLNQLYEGKCDELTEMTRVADRWMRKCQALEKRVAS